MDDRFLGSTGLKVSELCLGTMIFPEPVDADTGFAILDRFVDGGGSFLDTADVYGQGASEEFLGRWLKQRDRDALVIATKAFGRMGPGPNDEGVGRKHVLSAVEASLRRLGTDYIDLYQVHVYDAATPQEETLSTLDTLVKSGKVRFVGASNYTGWQLQKGIELSRQHGWERYSCLQASYSLLNRDVEHDLVPVCVNEGLGLIAFGPLEVGRLAGGFRRGMASPLAGTRLARDDNWAEGGDHLWNVVDAVHAIAEDAGKTPAQVSLRWLLQQPGVTAPIFGASSVDQLEENLGATGWSLTDEQLSRLTAASDRPTPYPYRTIRDYGRHR